MRTVLGLAAAALVALMVALLTGSTLAAVVVVMLALAGIVLLLRDWRAESAAAPRNLAGPAAPEQSPAAPITADEHSPDIAGPDQL